ncbi:hypothetical protein HXX76_014042 [Chlamydomonas incerta]|uniref:Uncharacterized protein n=1 Tax=Chlamydomonas incerta TaxID=51695 RepID=A0A835SDC7_CHLIN|nr:hypothetical protein HXX76_014042 [Chlamydomonas incerta]|eukprot:KAG2424884.1 hypothetical protein HXX76_014042 [Chlamydomonas incerta]
MMSVVMQYNANIVLPNLNDVGEAAVSAPPDTSVVRFDGMPVQRTERISMSKRKDAWKYVLLFSAAIMGPTFTPNDSLFTELWQALREPDTPKTLVELFQDVLSLLLTKDSIRKAWTTDAVVIVDHVLSNGGRALLAPADLTTALGRATDGCTIYRTVTSVQADAIQYSYSLVLATPFSAASGKTTIKGALQVSALGKIARLKQDTPAASKVFFFTQDAQPSQYLLSALLQKDRGLAGSTITLEAPTRPVLSTFGTAASSLVGPTNTFEAAINVPNAAKRQAPLALLINSVTSTDIVYGTSDHLLRLCMDVGPGTTNSNVLLLSDFAPPKAPVAAGSTDTIYVSRSLQQVVRFDISLDDGLLASASLVPEA